MVRSLLLATALSVFSFALSACVRCTVRDQALRERPDLTTPELAFETLRATIRCKDPVVGYLVLSEEMKQRDRIDLSLFILGWEEFFHRYPSSRLAGAAEIREVILDPGETPPRRCRLVASVYGKELVLDLVRQDFFEVEVEGLEDRVEGYVPSLRILLARPAERPDVLAILLADPLLRGVSADRIRSVRIGSEWKVSRFGEGTEASAGAGAP